MKKMEHKLTRLSRFILTLAALALSACGPREAEPWRSVLKQYAGEGTVRELLLVQYKGGSDAGVTY